MTVANLWLVFKIVGFLLWVAIFLVIALVLYFLWEEFGGQNYKYCNKNINSQRSFWTITWYFINVRIGFYSMSYAMEVLFRYLVFDDFGEPIIRFRTKHEAECYVLHKPNHRIERLPPQPKENVFDLIKDEPPF